MVQALRRERLLDALVAAPHRLLLVTGPAGCGKTTLLTQFVQAAGETGSTVWYHVDGGDARAPVLLRHLAHALGTVVGGLAGGWGTVEEAVADLEQVPGPAGDRSGPRRDRRAGHDHHGDGGDAGGDTGPDGGERGGQVLLALDDLHVLAGTGAEDVLGHLLELAPPWLRVAATCRQPPAWNLSRLRVHGALFEVGPDDLRFRSWEVERLFSELYREPLPPGDLAQLTRGLEGWAAGLQMFHLATRGKPVSDRRRAVAALPARSKLIREYLTGNVLDELPEELRSFLVDTCVLGRLSPALGDALRDRDDSARLLGELEARHVFVDRLDDGTYRYHEVFRTYLEGRLVERDGQEGARARSRRAAELLEGAGLMLPALRAWCRAEDWTAVGRVLETAGPELVEDSVSWLDWLPPGLIEDDPWAMLAAARRAVATGRLVRALDLYARAERVPGAPGAAEIARRERAGIACWVDPTARPPTGWVGRMRVALRSRPGAVADVAALPAVAPTLDPGHATDAGGAHAGPALVAGVAGLLAGDLRTAQRWLAPLGHDPQADPLVAASARVALAIARLVGSGADLVARDPYHRDAEPGRGPAAVDDLPELAEVAEAPWLSWLARGVRGLDGTPEGWRQALEAADALDRHGDAWGSAAARLFAVLGAVVAGASPVGELDDLCRRLQLLDAAVPEAWCRAWRATALARRQLSDLRRLDRPRHDRAPPGGPSGHAGGGRGGGGHEGDAAAAAREAEEVAARVGAPGAQVWAVTVQAQIALAAGDGEAAAAHLERAGALRREAGVDVVVAPLHVERPGAGEPARAGPAGGGPAASLPTLLPAVSPRRPDTGGGASGPAGTAAGGSDRPSGNGSAPGDTATAAAPPAHAVHLAHPVHSTLPTHLTHPDHPGRPVPLRVRCFGGLSLEVGGRPVDLRSAKPRVRAALRLLAAHAGRPVHVETLVESLWPGGDPAAGKRNLQVAVSSVRRLLDRHQDGSGRLVARDGDAYLLAMPEGAEADVVAFAAGRDEARAAARRRDAAAVLAAGERAVGAYRGELLPEEGPTEWAVQLRRKLAGDAAEVALLVAESALHLGRWEAAVAACTRGLEIDRYSDALWRLLVAAHERGGDRAAAAQAQERYRLVLRDLGMAAG